MSPQKLFIPGVAEYPFCKARFLLAGELLKEPDKNKKALTDILQTFNDHPDTVDFLKAEYGQAYDRIYDNLTKVCSRSLLNQRVILDELPVDNGWRRTQDEWIDCWNNVNDGRVMASMGDLYLSFKLLKQQIEQGAAEEKAQAQNLLASLRQDFGWLDRCNLLVSSTRLTYQADSLEGTITQHYRCNRPELIKETRLLIPVYWGSAISSAANSSDGLKYLQTLYDTGDDAETVMQTLEFVSGKQRNQIMVWTAAVDGNFTRIRHPNRKAGLSYGNGNFHVFGGDDIGNRGRSRGTLIKSAQRRIKVGTK